MAYDEGLAQRLREHLDDTPVVIEKKMFGGVAFLVNGNMSVGVVKDSLMVRSDPSRDAELLGRPHARPMDFTGRPMKGWVFVAPAGYAEDGDLASWVAEGVGYARSLPAK